MNQKSDYSRALALSLVSFAGSALLPGCERESPSPISFTHPTHAGRESIPEVVSLAVEIKKDVWALPSRRGGPELNSAFEKRHPGLEVVAAFLAEPSTYAPEIQEILKVKGVTDPGVEAPLYHPVQLLIVKSSSETQRE